jgi:hypothetical protein
MNKSSFIIVIALVIIFGVITGYQNHKINTLESQSKIEVLVGGDIEKEQLRNRVDSLHDELFISKVQNGRYELTLEHLNEVNPKAALEFVNFMNHETE